MGRIADALGAFEDVVEKVGLRYRPGTRARGYHGFSPAFQRKTGGLLPKGRGKQRRLKGEAKSLAGEHEGIAGSKAFVRDGVDPKRPRSGHWRSGAEQIRLLNSDIAHHGGRAKRLRAIASYLDRRLKRKRVVKALRISGGVRISPAQRRRIATRTTAGDREHGVKPRRERPGRDLIAEGQARRRMFFNLKHKIGGYGDWPGKTRARVLDRERAKIEAHQLKQGRPSSYTRGIGGRRKLKKAKPKTLYVYRPLTEECAEAFLTWAKAQGFKKTLKASDLHVTLAYSKEPVNWARLHDDWRMEPAEEKARDAYLGSAMCVSRWSEDGNKRRRIEGGKREVAALGDDGAVVLKFESVSLTERWADFRRAGASWDYPSFQPHISISYDASGVDLASVEPFEGPIVLGEECWEEIDPKGQERAVANQVTKALADLETRLAVIEAKEDAA